MTEEKAIPLSVRPLISYPQEAEVGKKYLMTIDLEQDGDKWPYEEEEYPVYCMLHTSPLFTNKPLDTPAVVLHRFGGTYGPAKFILTAAQKARKGEIRLTLVNKQGVPLQVIRLPEIRVVRKASRKPKVVGTLEAREQRPERRKSTLFNKPITPIEREPDKKPQTPSWHWLNHINIEQLRKDLHQALKMWNRDSSEESSLDYLSLFHQFRRQGYSIRDATNQVIFNGLAALEKDNAMQADFLRRRFIDEQSVRIVATYFDVRESYVYNWQKHAISSLAEKVKGMEDVAIYARQKTLETRLPLPTYSYLIGVEEHLSILRQVLIAPERPWVVSIEGIGGIGKTSLADALSRQIISEGFFDDFAWVTARQGMFNFGGSLKLLDKPAVTVEELVEGLVMQLLGFTPAQLSGKHAFDALHHRLKERPHLIVIDNLDTMLDVESLLPSLRRLANPSKFLLTCRESLYGEPDVYHFVVPPLRASDALQLIRQEASLRLHYLLAEASDENLLPIYYAVGGNPLALRLVVGQAHFRHLSVILSDLEAARGESVENVYRYIYRQAWDNLDEVTRRLFLVMPLLPEQGGLLSQMAHASQLDPSALRKSLSVLITLNLVEMKHGQTESRYAINNLARTFLQEQVAKWGFSSTGLNTDAPKLFQIYTVRSVEYVLAHTQQSGTNWPLEQQKQALHALSLAHNVNFSAPNETWPVMRNLLLAMAPKMEQAGHNDEWIVYLQSGIEQSQKLGDTETEAELQFQLGTLYEHQAKYDQAHPKFEDSAALFEQLGNSHYQARSLISLANVMRRQRRLDEAKQLVEAAQELLGEEKAEKAHSYRVLGIIAFDQHQWQDAYNFLSKSLSLWEEVNNQRMIAWVLTNLGVVLWKIGKYEDAIAYYKRAINEFEIIQNPVHQALVRMNLGNVYIELDHFELALELYSLAQPIFHKTQDKLRLAMLNNNKGMVYQKLQQWDKAKQAYLVSIELWQGIDHIGSLINVMDNLGLVYLEQGLYDQAKDVFGEALNMLAQIKDDPNYDILFDMVSVHLREVQENNDSKLTPD